MEKKPSVFVNKVDKKFENNARVYYGKATEERSATLSSSSIKPNIEQKISNIFASPSYVYKAEVKIHLKSGIVTKKIVGKNRNYLITMDNELIPIQDIIDIEVI